MGWIKNFFRLPNEVLIDRRLGLRDLKVLASIASFRQKDQTIVTIKRSKIAARAGLNSTAVTTATARLQKFGWLKKEGNGGCSRPAAYSLFLPDFSSETSSEYGYLESEQGTSLDSGEGSPPDSGEGKEQIFLQENNNKNLGAIISKEEENKLSEVGLSFLYIKNIFEKHPKDLIFEKIALLAIAKKNGTQVQNPAAFLACAIAQNWQAPISTPPPERHASHVLFPTSENCPPSSQKLEIESQQPDPAQVKAWLDQQHPKTQKDFAEIGFNSHRLLATFQTWRAKNEPTSNPPN